MATMQNPIDDVATNKVLRDFLSQFARSIQGDRSQTSINLMNNIGTYLDGNGKLSPAAVSLILSYARQNNINIPDSVLAQLRAETATTGENIPEAGSGLTSGTADGNVSLLERARQAAMKGAGAVSSPGASPLNDGSIPFNQSTQTRVDTSVSNGGRGAQQTPLTPNTTPGATAFQDNALGNDDQLVRYAMQQAGLNPDRLTKFSRMAGASLVPLLRSLRAAQGIANDVPGGLTESVANFAKNYTSGGSTGFFNSARDIARTAMGSENFKNAVAGLQSQEQVAGLYQSLLPLLFAGSNPLIAQSAADTFERTNNQYNDADFANSGVNTPVFLTWLAQQQLDPVARRIFGR